MDEDDLHELTENTIRSSKRLATVAFGFRQLRDETPAAEELLHQKIGSARYVELICATATLQDVVIILEYVPPAMAKEIVGSLTDPVLEAVVERTVALQSSLGGIAIRLAGVGSDRGNSIVRFVTQRFGLRRLGAVIAATGSLYDLLEIATSLSPTQAAELARTVFHHISIETLVERMSELVARRLGYTFDVVTRRAALRQILDAQMNPTAVCAVLSKIDRFDVIRTISTALSDPVRIALLSDSRFLLSLPAIRESLELTVFAALIRSLGEDSAMVAVDENAPVLRTMREHLATAEWMTLNSIFRILSGIESALAQYITKEVTSRALMHAAESVTGCVEGIHRTALLARLRPTEVSECADSMFPQPQESATDDWIRSAPILGELILTRWRNSATRFLNAANTVEAAAGIRACGRSDVTAYLWTLYEVATDAGGLTEQRCREWIRPEIITAALDVWQPNAAGDARRVVVNIFALAGALHLVGTRVPKLDGAIAHRLLPAIERVDCQSTVTIMLFMKGMAALGVSIPPDTLRRLEIRAATASNDMPHTSARRNLEKGMRKLFFANRSLA